MARTGPDPLEADMAALGPACPCCGEPIAGHEPTGMLVEEEPTDEDGNPIEPDG